MKDFFIFLSFCFVNLSVMHRVKSPLVGEENGGARMRVLLVEDDRRLSQSLKMSLMDEGYAVDAAFDGAEGEEFAEVVSYDAIILDVMLPVKDGVAVCRSLRARKVNTPFYYYLHRYCA